MKLNLGCGNVILEGFTNVDFFISQEMENIAKTTDRELRRVDLSAFPWPFEDSSADVVMMHDFLEHFSWMDEGKIIQECSRILKEGGRIDIQVPDFEICAAAAFDRDTGCNVPFECHNCGKEFSGLTTCSECGTHHGKIQEAAIHRLYGGQDRSGNWHYNAFTKHTLSRLLKKHGFENVMFLLKNQNGETYRQNWNMRAIATKGTNW